MTIEKLKMAEPLFGSWYVESKIAEGRSSKVFKVRKQLDGATEYMCVKTLKFPADNNALKRVIESGKYNTVDEYLSVLEANVRANMDKMLQLKDNGNIVSYENYGIVKESSCFYVVMLMELLTPLSDHLKADRINAREVIKIGWDLSNALEGFRYEGIMHHNIKPDNIYVDNKGNYKLGDFGISEAENSDREIGAYSAPELFSGDCLDTASDIYSLGVVLYKLLNNNRGPFLPPFPAPISLSDRENATAKRLRGDLFPTPAGADYELAKIIFKATAFNPTERFSTPFLMRLELENYVRAASARASAAPTASTQVKVKPTTAPPPRATRPDGASSVTSKDKNDFKEAFADNEADDYEDNPNKKWYFIIMAVVIVLALIIGLVVKSVSGRKEDPTTTEPTTSQTTEEVTTEETSAEETTEKTTEETTEETTTEETTEQTTEEKTEETTAEETTEEETTEEQTSSSEPTTEPVLVSTDKAEGDRSEDGKIYASIQSSIVTKKLSNKNQNKIVLEIYGDLGASPMVSGNVFIAMYYDGECIQKVNPGTSISDDGSGRYVCEITVYDEEFYYEPSDHQYYLCLEEGAIETDSSVSLPLQIKL